jgi:hypothetical protein
MAARIGLGDLYNLLPSITTAKQRLNMENAAVAGCLMVGASAVTNLTLNECNAASGGTEQALAVVTTYWTQAAAATPTAWTKVTQGAASTVPSINGGLTYFEVSGVSMSDGFKYLDATHATATMIWIPHGLQVKRTPENLKSAIL